MLMRSGLMMRPVRAIWNPSDKGANITLSNGNLSASNSGLSNAIRATLGKSAGKWVFEVVVSVTSGGNGHFIGIATTGAGLSPDLGDDAFGWAYRDNGTRRNNASSTAGYATYTAGDAITVYFDAGAGKVWWAKNGVIQGGGSPSAGTSAGYSTGAITAYPAISTSGNGKLTIRPTAYALPTGFVPW